MNDELRKKQTEIEDEVLKETDSWPHSKRLIYYGTLNRRHGCTMINIEYGIERA